MNNKNFIELYRALPEQDIVIYPAKGDLLSEGMSRVISSSGLNPTPYFICFTEDIRIAFKYAKKQGYSGKIARITVAVKDDSLLVVNNAQAELFRTWHLIDWLELAKKSNWVNVATNLNYTSHPQMTIGDIISYQGRKSPRAFAHADFSFILHSAGPLKYDVLSDAQIAELLEKKRYYLKSLRLISYNFSDLDSKAYIEKLIGLFKNRDQAKAYNRIIIKQLEQLIMN